MAFDLGALRLLITDQGGTAVLGRLKQIEVAGKQTQATFQKIASTNALAGVANQARAGTVAMTRQIAALGQLHRAGQLTNADTRLAISLQQQLTAALNSGNLSLQKRGQIAAQSARLSKITASAGAASIVAGAPIPGVVGSIKAALPVFGVLAATMAATNLVGWMTDSARAADDFERANRRLSASAKLTGVALSELEGVARSGQESFGLARTVAADFAAEITRLTSIAGRVGESRQALKAFLDLGASRGFDAAQTLQAVRQAVLGIDEGTDKLFNRNPSGLWREYAAAIGTTVGKLTDAQKQEALLAAALRDGAKVGGEYEKFLQTAAGSSAKLAQANERLKVAFGRMFAGVRVDVTSSGASLLTWIADGIDKFREFDRAGEQFWQNLARRMRILAPLPTPTLPSVTVSPNNTRAPIEISGAETEAEKIAKVIARLEEERQSRIAAQVAAIGKLVDLRKLEVADLDTLFTLERALTKELEKGNASLLRRVEIHEQLIALQGMLGSAPGVRDMTASKEAKPEFQGFDVPEHIQKQLEGGGLKIPQGVLDDAARRMELERQFSDAVGNAIASGIINGFAVGLAQGGIAEGFAQMGSQILQQMGSLFIDIGVQAILAGKLMAGIMTFLWSNPLLAIGLGVGMIALGSSLGGKRRSTGRGSSIGTGSLIGGNDTTHIQIADRAGSVPQRRMALPGGRGTVGQMAAPVTINTMLLNPNDPASQRLLAQAVRAGERRGL
jgi:hypothetical protein